HRRADLRGRHRPLGRLAALTAGTRWPGTGGAARPAGSLGPARELGPASAPATRGAGARRATPGDEEPPFSPGVGAFSRRKAVRPRVRDSGMTVIGPKPSC